MIDCSHANSQKKHENQILVAKDIAEQLAAGSHEVGPLPLLLFLLFPSSDMYIRNIYTCICIMYVYT